MQYQAIEFDKLAGFDARVWELDLSKLKEPKLFDGRGRNIPRGMCYTFGKTIAARLKEAKQEFFLISGDGRRDTPYIIEELTQALTEAGINVLYAGYNNTTPMFETERERLQICGANVTASHQSSEYNGVKLVIDIRNPNLGNLLSSPSVKRGRKNVFFVGEELEQDYLDNLDQRIGKINFDGEILYDALQGVSFDVFKEIARRKRIKFKAFRAKPDGLFQLTFNGPDPLDAENFRILRSFFDISKYSLVAIVDGDGDRFGLATPSGFVASPYLAALRAEFSGKKGFVAEHCLGSIIQDYLRDNSRNITVISCNRGRTNFIPEIKKLGVLGAEIALHNYNSMGIDDGVENTFELIKIIERLGGDKKLEEKLREIETKTRRFYPEIRVRTNRPSKRIVDELAKNPSYSHDLKRDSNGKPIDGICIHTPEFGIFIRGSSNENSLTINVNWKNGEYYQAEEKLDVAVKSLEKIEQGLGDRITRRLAELNVSC